MSSIPISQAWICCNCDVVLDQAQTCPRCGSGKSIASLSAWLNRASGIREVLEALDHVSAVRVPRVAAAK